MSNLQRVINRTDLEHYIAKNRGTCPRCKTERVFWCSTSKGKRIPMEFPNTALGHDPTHELVLGYGENGWDGTCEAWPSDHKPTHACHWDHCQGDPEENHRKEVAAYDARRKAERDAVVSEGWS